MKMVSLVLFWFGLGIAQAADRQAASASQADVQAAIDNASPGDTILVPGGNGSWSGLQINKAVHLKGNGTTIDLTGTNTATKQSAGVIRISGFTFNRSNGSGYAWSFTGPWKGAEPIVFENNKVNVSGAGFSRISTPGGVIIAGNDFTAGWDDSLMQLKNPGDTYGSWKANSTMGTADTDGKLNIYVENNTFYGGTNQGIDADDASRVVFRNNLCKYMSFNSHGLDTSEDGVRHFEVYNNKFQNDAAGGWTGGTSNNDVSNQNWAIWIRGGTGVIFNNWLDNIANSNWGYGKVEAKFDIRAQQDNSGTGYGTKPPPVAKYSAGKGDYPRERQLGQSWDESRSNSVGINNGKGDYITDPIWVWGNTGPGSSNGSFLAWGKNSWGNSDGYFNSGRDYQFGNTPKPGYVAYKYPHPLTSAAGPPQPTPTPTATPTPTPTPSPTPTPTPTPGPTPKLKISDIEGLQQALDSKSNQGHSHVVPATQTQ
jgi:hypothetical protein